MKKPTEEQEHIAMELYRKNPFVIAAKRKPFRPNFFQGFCIGFIIGATIMKIVFQNT